LSLRCVYTDLDGTLLGRYGSLFADAEGNWSNAAVRAIEACFRAGVELVIMSGRRESTVGADSRLLGQTSYIYEAGCGVVIDGERTLLTGDWRPDETGSPAEQMAAAGLPDLLFAAFPGKLEWHAPWHTGRELSHLFRGEADVAAANALLAERGHDDVRFLDNGAISRPMPDIDIVHAYHLVPGGASKAQAVAFHAQARGYEREETIAIGDSLEDLDAAASVGRFFVVANGPVRDQALREALSVYPNVTVTEGAMGEGVYEAIVSTLAHRGE
jgi:hydroxymethylpyrimidine pyrophosphatase-like HAD family hydrolase